MKIKLKTSPDDLTEAVFQTMLIGIKEISNIAPAIVQVKITPVSKIVYMSKQQYNHF